MKVISMSYNVLKFQVCANETGVDVLLNRPTISEQKRTTFAIAMTRRP